MNADTDAIFGEHKSSVQLFMFHVIIMRNLSTPAFKRALKRIPAPSESAKRNFMYLSGYLNYTGNEEVLEIASRVEDIVRESFSSAQINGTQTLFSKTEEYDGHRYDASIYASMTDRTLAELRLVVVSRNGQSTYPYKFEAIFSMGDYAARTRAAITKLWPMISFIEYAYPIIPEEIKNSKNRKNFRDGSIVLMKNGVIVAAGSPPALFQAGLGNLSKKYLRH